MYIYSNFIVEAGYFVVQIVVQAAIQTPKALQLLHLLINLF